MTVDKHEVESRIEAAEVELNAAKEALKNLKNTPELEQEFVGYLRQMYLRDNLIHITASRPNYLAGYIVDTYIIYAEAIPPDFYKKWQVHISRGSTEGVQFVIQQRRLSS